MLSGRRGRLWIVSELYFPEETSTGYFMTRIAEGLASSFDVNVIAGKSGYAARNVSGAAHEIRGGVHIRRIISSYFNKDRIVLRMLNILFFTVAVFFTLLIRVRRGDLLLVVTNPPTMSLIVGLSARMKRARSVLLVHDVYPEVLNAASFLRSESFFYRMLKRVFAFSFHLFDRVVVIGRDMEAVVRGKIGSGSPRIFRIPNWGDVDELRPLSVEENGFRIAQGLAGKVVLQFSGNVGRTHDVEIIMELADRLQDAPSFHVLIAGYGGKLAFVEKEIARRNLKNVTLLPRQPRARLNEMLSTSDVSIITLVDRMYGLSVPSRLYNVMAVGVPIIAMAHPASELSLVVSENESGWVVPAGRIDLLESLMRDLLKPDGLREARRRGANGRSAVCQSYTEAGTIEKFRLLLVEMAAEGFPMGDGPDSAPFDC